MEKFCEKLVRYRVPLLILACVVAVAFPFVFPSKYFIRIGTVCLMYVMITLSLNLMVGYMGQMSFGHAAFMGIGAYTAAILTTTYDVPFFVAFILAGVVAGLFGLLLGLPVLKLKGYYFTIITMVFCEIVRVVELNWMSLTRGPLGIMAIPKPSFLGFEITTPRQFYFMILVLVALSTLVVSNLMKSRVGYAILAIRDDELAAEAMGIHVFRYKMIVFILSSLLVGLAGAFYATYTSYIDPSSFAAAQSNDMLVMVIFGGLGNTVGSFIGAISLSILPEALRDLAQYRQLIYGVLLVLLMMVKPQGLLGDINFKYIRQRMPDPMLTLDDLEKCGYRDGDMLPLSKERAMELYERDLTVYAVVDGGSAEMLFDWEELALLSVDRKRK